MSNPSAIQVDPDELASRAAKSLLRKELSSLVSGLEGVVAHSKASKRERATHGVRVSTRRLSAMFSVLRPVLDPAADRKAEDLLRTIRRTAGAVRDADVHLALLKDGRAAAPKIERQAWDGLIEDTSEKQRAALGKLVRLAKKVDASAVRKLTKRLMTQPKRPIEPAATASPRVHWTLRDAVQRAIPQLLTEVIATAEQDLTVLDHAHALRVRCKALRYALEMFASIIDEELALRAVGSLTELQRDFGDLNDADRLLARMQAHARGLERRSRLKAREHDRLVLLAKIVVRQQLVVKRLHRTALRTWKELSQGGLVRLIQAAVGTQTGEPRPLGLIVASTPLASPSAQQAGHGAAQALRNGVAHLNGHAHMPHRRAGSTAHAHPLDVRLGAIDVGTNSIRLIVAEAQPDGTYRVLDDEKDTTRLGQGLDATGRLDEQAMEQSASAIARMATIAHGFGVSRLRAVATCAVREASNGQAFCDLVKQWSGLDLEVITAQEEAALAYRSVAASFDLSLLTVAVVDIGGGSTEVVLASGGVIEKVYTLPIGAVRMTERFGGPEHSAGDRFKPLKRWLAECFAQRINRPPLQAQLVIATGGTTTSLGTVALQHSVSGGQPAPGAAVQGLELKRSTVARILRQLRAMDLPARARVPGLAPERADIIVPGGAILHGLMKHLDVRRLRVHAGGIRDGLLLTMVREIFPSEPQVAGGPTAGALDPLKGVYRLAQACRFDERHSEHVAHLSLRLFDQLAAIHRARKRKAVPAWASDESRLLLRAAALVLDVGYLINYAQHHLHSYNLIRHSDLPGLSARQVELIASIARYHRASEPKVSHNHFARLSESDQDLVRRLAGIVRVAVGLDRGHRQVVRDVLASATPDGLRIAALATTDPAVDVWAAQRKSKLLAKAFGDEVSIVWKAPDDGAGLNRPTAHVLTKPRAQHPTRPR